MSEVSEHRGEIDELPVFWRSSPAAATPGRDDGPSTQGAPTQGPPTQGSSIQALPTLYLHGVPTNSDDWLPFLERSGGIAPDLPGFGRSGKPGFRDYTIEEYADFIESFLDFLEIERVHLVVHDWGSLGLVFAQRHPERVERVVVINAVPLLAGFRWHRTARLWRTPLIGELAMGMTTRWMLTRETREANATPGPMPDEFLDSVLDHFDQGTQRAILRLYRSAPSEVLARAGERLGDLTGRALVVWGARDPYIPLHFAADYARALGGAELLEIPDAGHWPWLDRPEVIDRVVDFLAAR